MGDYGLLTSHFPASTTLLGDSNVDPVETRYPATEACREGSQLAQVTDFVQPDEIVCHAFEIGIDADDDVE